MIPCKVLICDDHAVVRAGLRLILEAEKDFHLVGEAETAEQAIELAARYQPELVMMDITLPGMKGVEAIPRLLSVAPGTKVLILTVHDDEAYFFQALQKGAAGYILKGATVSEILAAMRLVISGGVAIPRTLSPRLLKDFQERTDGQASSTDDPLSLREREVLRLICKGRTNKQIAEEMYLSVRTVERHRSSIMRKASLENRAELVAYAIRQGILGGSGMS